MLQQSKVIQSLNKDIVASRVFQIFGSFHRRALVGLCDASTREEPKHVALLTKSIGLQGLEGPPCSLHSTRLGGEMKAEDDHSSRIRCNKTKAVVYQARWHNR